MSEAMEKAWTVWWGSLRASKEWQGLPMDAARAAFEMGWGLRKAAEFEKAFGGGYVGTCDACGVEAAIGTEEVPHPVDARLHTCRGPQ